LSNFPLPTPKAGSQDHNPITGLPVIWLAGVQGWTVALEHGTPTQSQTEALTMMVPPFTTDAIYPARHRPPASCENRIRVNSAFRLKRSPKE
jgi:hypothetical protein